jgi:outer membrane protein TolC
MNYLKIPLYIFVLSLQMLFSFSAQAQEQTLTLQEAISLALENNRNLKVSDLDVSRAQQQTRIAKSKALPSVNLTGQYAHYFDRPVFFGLGGTSTQEDDKLTYSRVGGEDQFAATISVVQPLYNPSVKPELKRARLAENNSRLSRVDREAEVVASVKQTYLRVLVLNERLKLQHESLNRNKKVLDDAKSLYAQGRALRVDTLRAYTTVKNLQPDITRLSDAITVSKLQLITLLGIQDKEDVALTDSLFIHTLNNVPTEGELYEEAKTKRPDLQILSLQEQISAQQVSAARAGKLPSLSLVGQYQVNTQTNSFHFDNAYWPSVSFAGAQLTIPLFNGFSQSAKVKEAKFAEQQSTLQLTDAKEQLKVEVRQVVANVHEAAERLETQTSVQETAKLSYDIIQYRYKKGVASRLELTDAELALTTAQSNYLEAVYDYLSAHIQLDRTAGRTGH